MPTLSRTCDGCRFSRVSTGSISGNCICIVHKQRFHIIIGNVQHQLPSRSSPSTTRPTSTSFPRATCSTWPLRSPPMRRCNRKKSSSSSITLSNDSTVLHTRNGATFEALMPSIPAHNHDNIPPHTHKSFCSLTRQPQHCTDTGSL